MDAGIHLTSEIAAPPAAAAADQQGMRTIIGLGNELLSDDGLGIRVVRELRTRLPAGDATLEELSVGGLQLLDYITGRAECVVVDAVASGAHPPGTIYRCVVENPECTIPVRSSHQIDLMQVVRLAGLLGADLPRRIVIYGIEAADITTFHEGCTDAVSRAIPILAGMICRDLARGHSLTGDEPAGWMIVHHTLPD